MASTKNTASLTSSTAIPPTAAAGFDFSNFDPMVSTWEDGVWFDVLHPATGKPVGARIRVASYESERAKQAQRRIADQRLKEQRRQTTSEQLETEARSVVAALVVDWEGVQLNGTTLEPTRENIEAIFRRYPFIQRQADAKAGDLAAFLET